MRLVEFTKSPLAGKRFVARFHEPHRDIHFGEYKHNTFIDHGNVAMRHNHVLRKQHLFQENSFRLDADVMTTAILWGPTQSIEGNLAWFLNRYHIQDSR